MSESMTGGAALARQLRAQGVEVIFGLPGDQLMSALDALVDVPEIRYLVTRHEQATTYMADGYARAGGRPGVAMVVPGVGVYNAASGLATAYACSSPVLLIAGQVNREGIGRDLGLLHDLHDQLDVVRPITKLARRVLDPAEIPGAVRDAFHVMTSGRPRPAELEIPPETFAETAAIELLAPIAADTPSVDLEALERAAAVLAAAVSPVIVAGGGVVLGDASEALTAVAERLQAPVITTREGKGAIDDRHPLSVGTMWVNSRMRPVIDGADVILAVGSRFQGFGLSAEQQLVQIDVDPDQIGRNRAADVAVEGDARTALVALADMITPRPSRTDEIRGMRLTADAALQTVGPQAAMVEALRAGVPDDGILVCDTTTVAYMCHMYYPVYEPRTYLSTSYMGTLGFAFPAALGAKVARPERPVVTVVGDGGFLFASNELATAMQHGIHTVTVVFDDGAYGNSNRDQREKFGGRELGTALENPDWVMLAHAFGAEGMVVDDVGKLAAAMDGAIEATTGASGTSTVIAVPMDRLPSPF